MGLSLPLLARAIAGPLEAVATDIGLLYGVNTAGRRGRRLRSPAGCSSARWATPARSMSGAVLNLAVAARIWFARRGMPPETATGTASGAMPRPLWHGAPAGLDLERPRLPLRLPRHRARDRLVPAPGRADAEQRLRLLAGARGVPLRRRAGHRRRRLPGPAGAGPAPPLPAASRAAMAALPPSSPCWRSISRTTRSAASSPSRPGYYDTIPRLLAIMALTVLMVLPPAFLLGMSFPITQRAVQDDPALVGQRVGTIQLFNILGNAAGALVTGLLLLHWLGVSGTLRLIGLAEPGAPAAAPPRRPPAPARSWRWQPPLLPWSSCSPATSSSGAGCTGPGARERHRRRGPHRASPCSARRRRGGQAGGSISAATPTAACPSALSRVPWERWACWSTRTRGRC